MSPSNRKAFLPMADSHISDAASAKAALRKQAAIKRNEAALNLPDGASRLAARCDDIKAQFQPTLIAAYWPIKSELDPLALLRALCRDGRGACLPRTPEEGKPLQFHHWDFVTELEDGPYHTKQPSKDAAPALPDLILAPLLAFDTAFWRLGYGGGFYDRTIAHLEELGTKPIILGVAYDEQQVDDVPTGPYDMPLDGIVTPQALTVK